MNKLNPSKLVSTAAAAETLKISVSQFRRIALARGIAPDETYKNPHYAKGPPAQLWGSKTIARLARTKDVATARESKGGKPSKDYASVFAARYVRREDALADACEALFNLNRYARHPTCSKPHREEVFKLKTRLVEHLYGLERFTDRVEKLTKHLSQKECSRCDGTGFARGDQCEKCDGTGVFAPARDVASYVFTFTVEGQRYTWMQPDRVMAFEPRVEATRVDDGKPRELDASLSIPRGKLAEAKALIRYALRNTGAPNEGSR
jgi:hypothetical protein